MKSKILSLLLVGSLLFSCNSVFDKENLTAINPDDVWNDFGLAQAYVDNLYATFMPGWNYNSGQNSDESPSSNGQNMNAVLKGQLLTNSVNYWPYGDIRKINILLEQVETGTLASDEVAVLKGQALFWRAWAYFGMVKNYGGVPLVLEVQNREDGDALKVSRNKTSECIAQIVKDLDDAAGMLPDKWTGANYGRIDKGAVLAVKGRVLLHYASPQFNPSNDMTRWAAAYDANKEAYDFLKGQGKALHHDFAGIWFSELNSETVMVHRYFNPGHTNNQNIMRPLYATKDAVGGDRPSLELVNAFPMKDGSDFDPAGGYEGFWQNRDDRFYATIAYPGSDYGLPELDGDYLWSYFYNDNGTERPYEEYKYGTRGNIWTGFYRAKALDKSLHGSVVDLCEVDWIEIRLAEVMLNYAEAANEAGHTTEALDMLYQIRERAGIEEGSGNYGIAESDKDMLRETIMKERFVELAFEGKRFDDLRRWRRFDYLNDLKVRHGLRIMVDDVNQGPDGTDDVNDFADQFTYTVFDVETLEGEQFNLKEEYYFYAIPQVHLSQNSNLEQTQGWDNGTFDPLQ
ncbi:RagB/SusD family nutrient uptake outer membrane protein [Echinicola sediminis]